MGTFRARIRIIRGPSKLCRLQGTMRSLPGKDFVWECQAMISGERRSHGGYISRAKSSEETSIRPFSLCNVYFRVKTGEHHLTVVFFFWHCPGFRQSVVNCAIAKHILSTTKQLFRDFLYFHFLLCQQRRFTCPPIHAGICPTPTVRHTKKDRQGPFPFGPRRSFYQSSNRDGKSRFCS